MNNRTTSNRKIIICWLWLTVLSLLVTACTLTPTETPTPGPALPQARVVNVVDGDTIDVLIDGTERRVRYILIDTPETKHPTKGIEPFGPEAFEANRQLVEGKLVGLEKDVSETDRFGRLLRYVYVDGIMVNEELLRRGLARVATFPPDVKYVDRFLELQRQAQAAGVGMWSAVTDEPPSPSPTPTRDGDEPVCDCSRNLYNCGDFDTRQSAQACFDYCRSVGRGDVHRLDSDGDGRVCESLP